MKKISALSVFLVGIWLLPLNNSFGLAIVRTSNMVTDNEAQRGMNDLLHILYNAGIIIAPLQDALNRNSFHQEGVDANGLTIAEGDEGVTFTPPSQGPFTITHYNNTLVFVDDPFTHIVHHGQTITDLHNRDFTDGISLKNSSDTAIHELLHATTFRTQCFQGNDEIFVSFELTPDIISTVEIFLAVQDGKTDFSVS